MPGVNGDDFLIQVHRKYPHIRSILVTGHLEEGVSERVKKEAGTFTIISKPWNSDELVKAVQFCCNQN